MREGKAYPSSSPPDYTPVDVHNASGPSTVSKWNPKGWPLWGKIAAGLLLVGIIIAIIVGAVVGSKNHKSYPNYSKLTYAIEDRYEGEGFFDDFDFFNDYDPAEGFVQ